MPRVRAASVPAPESTASRVRRAVTRARDRGRAWRIGDFSDMPALAVAQALSRLAREGVIVRMSKGVYAAKGSTPERVRVYDARAKTESHEDARRSRKAMSARRPAPVFPSSVLACNELYLSCQNAARPIVSTPGARAPREYLDRGFRVITRRPAAWRSLERLDGAILEVLREGAMHSELEPKHTAKVLAQGLRDRARLARVLAVAPAEPPRVRAMLGALIEHDRKLLEAMPAGGLESLRATLNPTSRYDFGQLAELSTASRWFARAGRPYF
jgi:hypothetical protein